MKARQDFGGTSEKHVPPSSAYLSLFLWCSLLVYFHSLGLENNMCDIFGMIGEEN
jgi:hypothetical protein